MKVSKLHVFWIMFMTMVYTANTSLRAVIKSFFGQVDRLWVDKTIHIWARHLLNLVQVKCTVINPYGIEPKPGQATILMFNHASLYDIPISYYSFPKHSLRWLAKKEILRIPLFGRALSVSEIPSIDRKNRRQAIEDLKKLHDLLESGIVMVVAPEGTRSHDGKLAPFKKGVFITAIEAKATIIPIGIRGAASLLPARTIQVNIGQPIELHIGKPMDASQYTLENKEILIEEVYQSLKKLVEG